MGKIRLTEEATALARDLGFLVLRGTCFQSDFASPYAPILDLLRGHFSGVGPDAVVRSLGAASRELGPLLPELLPAFADQPLTAADPVQTRRRLFATLAAFIFGLSLERPVLIVIEDAHWADEPSLDFLHHLARYVGAHRVLLLGTYRSDEIHPTFSRWLAQLAHDRVANEIALHGLGRDDVSAMLHAILGEARPVHRDTVDELFALTEGNPFFIEEVLATLVTGGELNPADGTLDHLPLDDIRVPHSIQEAMLRRAEHLSGAALQLLRLAAVSGHRFEIDLLEDLTGLEDLQLLEVLKERIALGLIVEESADRFSFRHPLTRQAIYAGLLGRERRTLHATIAKTLERAAGAKTVMAADLAHHYAQSGDWQHAFPHAVQAGTRALQLDAPRVAIQHFTLALDAAETLGLPQPLDALRGRGRARDSNGDFDGARRDYEAAATAARLAGDKRTCGEVFLELGLLWSGRSDGESRTYYQRALELARTSTEPVLLADSLNRVGNWLANAEQPADGLRHHDEALAIFQGLGEQRGLAATFDLLGAAHAIDGDLEKAAAAQRQAIKIFEGLDDKHGLASSLAILACCGLNLSVDTVAPALTMDEAEHAAQRALHLAQEIGWRAGETYALIRLGAAHTVRGDLGDALQLTQAALNLATEISHRRWTSSANNMVGGVYLELLAPLEARIHLDAAVAIAEELGCLQQLDFAIGRLASACVAAEDLSAAAAMLDRVLGSDVPMRTIAQRPLWCARAELALAAHKPQVALAIADKLLASTPHLVDASTSHIPRVTTLRGEALLALGAKGEAEMTLLAAHAGAVMLGYRTQQWRIELTLGRLMRSGHRHRESERWFNAARAGVEALAASVPDVKLRETFLQRANRMIPAANRGAGLRVTDAAPGGLTDRERDVAALIGRGLTNAQIARQLVLEKRTVETHVSHILAKLGYSSRAQVIAWVIERNVSTTNS
jgi:DNA-binding CsgD family transcriptional regulator